MNRHFRNTLLATINLFSITALSAQDTTFTNTIGMAFVRIKPGSFVMGSFSPPYPNSTDTGNDATVENGYTAAQYTRAKNLAAQDARPGFTVQLKQAFYIGKFEVTQAQWKKVTGVNPSVFQRSYVGDSADNHPVESVSWNEVQQFLKKLNALEPGRHYRLPTEAEWEYAARAGSLSDIPWTQMGAMAQLEGRTTAKVGGKAPNAWGLHDMLGNVWEWVADVYNEKPFAGPAPPKRGNQHVLKGASFTGDVKNATYMTHAAGPANGWDVGFRVVLEMAE